MLCNATSPLLSSSVWSFKCCRSPLPQHLNTLLGSFLPLHKYKTLPEKTHKIHSCQLCFSASYPWCELSSGNGKVFIHWKQLQQRTPKQRSPMTTQGNVKPMICKDWIYLKVRLSFRFAKTCYIWFRREFLIHCLLNLVLLWYSFIWCILLLLLLE